MATDTGADHFGVVHGNNGYERCGVMTLLAVIGRINVIGHLANDYQVVMTTDTGTDNLRVVDCYYRQPDTGVMTGLA